MKNWDNWVGLKVPSSIDKEGICGGFALHHGVSLRPEINEGTHLKCMDKSYRSAMDMKVVK